MSKLKIRPQWVAVSLMVVVVLGGLLMLARQQLRQQVYVIPAGTAAGQATIEVPLVIELTVGVKDILVIDNQDEVIHNFGPFAVAPHSQLIQEFDQPLEYRGACSLHPNEELTLRVNPAPWDIFW